MNFRGLNEKCGGPHGKFGICQKRFECVLMNDYVEDKSRSAGLCKGTCF